MATTFEKEIAPDLKQLGYEPIGKVNGEGHPVYRHPRGGMLAIPGTPGDRRAKANFLAKAKAKIRTADSHWMHFVNDIRREFDVPVRGSVKVTGFSLTGEAHKWIANQPKVVQRQIKPDGFTQSLRQSGVFYRERDWTRGTYEIRGAEYGQELEETPEQPPVTADMIRNKLAFEMQHSGNTTIAVAETAKRFEKSEEELFAILREDFKANPLSEQEIIEQARPLIDAQWGMVLTARYLGLRPADLQRIEMQPSANDLPEAAASPLNLIEQAVNQPQMVLPQNVFDALAEVVAPQARQIVEERETQLALVREHMTSMFIHQQAIADQTKELLAILGVEINQ